MITYNLSIFSRLFEHIEHALMAFYAYIFNILTGPIWAVCKIIVTDCNWHLTIYAALGCSLLMRARLAQMEHRYDHARGQICDGFLHFVIGLLAASH